MRVRDTFWIILIIAILVCAGCIAESNANGMPEQTNIKVVWTEKWTTLDNRHQHTLSKVIIPVDNITCYIASGVYGSSPSCVEGVR